MAGEVVEGDGRRSMRACPRPLPWGPWPSQHPPCVPVSSSSRGLATLRPHAGPPAVGTLGGGSWRLCRDAGEALRQWAERGQLPDADAKQLTMAEGGYVERSEGSEARTTGWLRWVGRVREEEATHAIVANSAWLSTIRKKYAWSTQDWFISLRRDKVVGHNDTLMEPGPGDAGQQHHPEDDRDASRNASWSLIGLEQESRHCRWSQDGHLVEVRASIRVQTVAPAVPGTRMLTSGPPKNRGPCRALLGMGYFSGPRDQHRSVH